MTYSVTMKGKEIGSNTVVDTIGKLLDAVLNGLFG